MSKSPMEDFLESFEVLNGYPDKFIERYEPLECLANNQMGETLLVKDRLSGEYSIVKCYCDRTLLSNANESDLLRNLHHSGLPAYIGDYENDSMLCVVREYVKGTVLDKLAKEAKIEERQAVAICAQLCDILSYLHAQTPPVIHRDIKPQNIILGDNGRIKLIDFGISRVYDENAQEDTVFFGTKYFAAPEQYGFSQTDSRTDIFSMGALLCWLLTGDADIRHGITKIKSKRLAAIVKKCTAFSPKDRYESAAQVKDALTGGKIRRTIVASLIAAAVIASSVFGVFHLIGNPFESWANTVRFEEPLIEQAVRLELDKTDSEPITKEELLSITELYIYGDSALNSIEQYNEYSNKFVTAGNSMKRGSISSLNDIAKMKNIKQLYLAFQSISDLRPLSKLALLEVLDLRHNLIADVQPLAGLPSLQMLTIFDATVSDFTALADCPALTVLDAGATPVVSLKAFDGIFNLHRLGLRKTSMQSLDGIEQFAALEFLCLSESGLTDLSALRSLSHLSILEVSEDMRDAAEPLRDRGIEIVYN